ncbi:period circadian protein [Coccinella septempunctata]|uniref:period circadian protein n=1 Tax=Coccinella septempunctata TaxID=41139 RepID=UPI001D076111|nr:period circadian protein [Coccinella septempunctata]
MPHLNDVLMHGNISFPIRPYYIMESENGTADTKVSDSGYSNSNSNSQRSASSKSRHSGSNSSRSSGYCGTTIPDGSDTGPQIPKRNKEKEHKKKKLKSASNNYDELFEVNNFITLQSEINCKDASKELSFTDVQIIIPNLETPKQADDAQKSADEKAAASHSTAESNKVETEKKEQTGDEVSKTEKEEKTEIIIEVDEIEPDQIPSSDKNTEFQPENGFCCVISINDGVVLYTTPSLTSVLGFPKDMWLGRSFIDFVHPKDRETFSSQVTMGIALPLVNLEDVKNSLHVCLRKYRGLKSTGFGVVEKSVSYQTFHLTVTFKRVADGPDKKFTDNNSNMFLVVVAVPVNSAFKLPDEKKKSNKFGMKHTSTCMFSHVDPDVVTNFGFLPQDMVGKSVFDFYHPEDMPLLKEVYESVMRMSQIAGSVFRSKPYRFAVQNGGFALIETKWSSFVNPWSRRLEFVIGLHRILQGPKNPQVFDLPKDDERKHISDEVMKNAKIIQSEILQLLNKEIARPKEVAKHQVSKRCKDLANFMESLMTEVKKCNLQLEVPHDSDLTVSERDSVMLGEISPHHDYEDSKSSSETPPSYNQLNYNENIERFFQSKPKTTASDGSAERDCTMANNSEADVEGKTSSYVNDNSHNQKCLSPIQNSGTSGSGSAGNLSSESSHLLEFRTPSAKSSDSYKPPPLTEDILHNLSLRRHNEYMEKIMIKKHKEYRSTNKETKKNRDKAEKLLYSADKANFEDKDNTINYNQGVKRAGSHSWEGDNHKVSKHKHQITSMNNTLTPDSPTNNSPPKNTNIPAQNLPNAPSNGNYQHPVISDVNLWPPFSVTVTPISNSNCNIATTAGGTGFHSGMFPVYYLPTQRTLPDYFNSSNPTRYQVHYMPGMMYNYNAIFPDPQPIMCFPVPLVPHPVHSSITPISQDAHQTNGIHMNNSVQASLNPELKSSPSGGVTNAQFQRPASQATSVKAEPGSAMGSISSASVANKALSECSRKDLVLPSVCSPSSPLVSPPAGDGDMENYNMNAKSKDAMKIQSDYRDNTTMDEGSSYYSSSYSSFFKTDTGSGSNDDSNTMDIKNLTSDDNSWRKNKNFPIRKRDPPWLKSVSVNPDLVYRYQMAVKDVENILEADLKALNGMKQPEAVNNQLSQLYHQMERGGKPKKITSDEAFLTSSSSSSDEPSFTNIPKEGKKKKSYSSLIMLYEENAPLPSPDK